VRGKGRNNPQRKGTRNFGTWTDSSYGLTPATRRLPAKGKPQDASHYTSQLKISFGSSKARRNATVKELGIYDQHAIWKTSKMR